MLRPCLPGSQSYLFPRPANVRLGKLDMLVESGIFREGYLMCRSLKEGGQRCAAHTRPKFVAALTSLQELPTDVEPALRLDALLALEEAACQYASTEEGAVSVPEAAALAQVQGHPDRASLLLGAAERGRRQRLAHQDIAAEVERVAAGKALGSAKELNKPSGYRKRVAAAVKAEKAAQVSPGEESSREAEEARREAAELQPGDHILVARGRKVPKGTRGRLVRLWAGQYGTRALLRTTEGEAVWVDVGHLSRDLEAEGLVTASGD